jgi:hypothetical protein
MPHSCLYLRGGGYQSLPAVAVEGVAFHRARFLPGQDNNQTAKQVPNT